MTKQAITTTTAPSPIGPYSQAVRFGGLLFVSGQVGVDPATGAGTTGIAAQTERTLRNLFAVAEAGGASASDALRLGVFLADMSLFGAFNDVYERLVPEPRPARITVVSDLGDWLVEIDGVFGLSDQAA